MGLIKGLQLKAAANWQLALLLNASWNELNVRAGELGGWGAEGWIPQGSGAGEERKDLKNTLAKSTDIPQGEIQGGSGI